MSTTATTTQASETIRSKSQYDAQGLKQQLDAIPSLQEIKSSIPKHLFQSNVSTSVYYVFKDLLIVITLYTLMKCIDVYARHLLHPTIFFALLTVYWFLQGTMFWAVFVLGHDCGHGSFSRHIQFNRFMGEFLHTIILVPFYPWKLSHKHHHNHTGHMDKDEIFFPFREGDFPEESPAEKRLLPTPSEAGFLLGVGWWYYLVKGYPPRGVSHFNVNEPMFENDKDKVLTSMISLSIWLPLTLYFSDSLVSFLVYYLIPVFVFGSWLVVTTFLHHQDEGSSWYGEQYWNYTIGNLQSIDRHYGWFHDLVHNIGTHQIHHLFPSVPHYHLEEATKHFRAKFPHLVRDRADEGVISAFVQNVKRYTTEAMNVEKDSQYFRYAVQAKETTSTVAGDKKHE